MHDFTCTLEAMKSNLRESEIDTDPVSVHNNPTGITDEANVEDLKRGINAPFVLVRPAPLSEAGGTLHITVSLQSREEWTNHILQNSPYFQLFLYADGTLETINPFSRTLKLRKTRVKSVEQAVAVINKYIDAAQNELITRTGRG